MKLEQLLTDLKAAQATAGTDGTRLEAIERVLAKLTPILERAPGLIKELLDWAEEMEWTYEERGDGGGHIYCRSCGTGYPSSRPWPHTSEAALAWKTHKPGCQIVALLEEAKR